MKKQEFDKRILELLNETLIEIQKLVDKTEEKEIRANDYFQCRPLYLMTVTNDYITVKDYKWLFPQKRKIFLKDLPLFILAEVLDFCSTYSDLYNHQKQYEKTRILNYLRSLPVKREHEKTHLISSTSKDYKKLMRKINRRFSHFVFYEQTELLIRHWLDYTE
jgi:hypothetical protein